MNPPGNVGAFAFQRPSAPAIQRRKTKDSKPNIPTYRVPAIRQDYESTIKNRLSFRNHCLSGSEPSPVDHGDGNCVDSTFMPTGRRPSEALQWRAVLGVANYRGRSTILPFSGRPWESVVTRLRGAQADATSGAHLPLPHHRSGWNRRVIDSFDCASPARTEFSTSNCGSGSENAAVRLAPRPSRR